MRFVVVSEFAVIGGYARSTELSGTYVPIISRESHHHVIFLADMDVERSRLYNLVESGLSWLKKKTLLVLEMPHC